METGETAALVQFSYPQTAFRIMKNGCNAGLQKATIIGEPVADLLIYATYRCHLER
jgi:hypothetical protein